MIRMLSLSGLLQVFMVVKLCILDMSYICYSGLLRVLKIVKKAGHSVSHSPLRMKIQGKHKIDGVGIIKLEN